MRRSSGVKLAAIAVLAIFAACAWYAVLREDRGGKLTVSFLDVGQGDSIFIDAPSGRQVLIDGGPDNSVLRQLSGAMPWWDRSIDVIVATHPDKDHIEGLVDVIARYRADLVLLPSVPGTTPEWAALMRSIDSAKEQGTRTLAAMRGQIIDLGDGAYLEVLSPDRPATGVDTNVGCIVTRLVYGKTSFMFSCDAPQAVENYLAALDEKSLKSDVLKAGHHGSSTASSPLFVGFVDPQYAVYSRACDNTYGFPSPQTVATFARFGVPTLDTCTQGTITFVSDGKTVTPE